MPQDNNSPASKSQSFRDRFTLFLERQNKKNILIGLVLVFLGILFLVSNIFDFSDYDLGFLLKLWPLIFVFLGATYLVVNKKSKVLFLALTSFVVALSVFAGYVFLRNLGVLKKDKNQNTVIERYDRNIRNASFLFKANAGNFTMKDVGKDLINADTEISFGEYILDKDINGDSADIELKMNSKSIPWRFTKAKNNVDIKLNGNPVWNMNFDISVSKADFDLTNYKVSKLKANIDASSIKIVLGDKSDIVNLDLDITASGITLVIPKATGIEVQSKNLLSMNKFDSLVKINKNTFRSENFDSSTKKVFVELEEDVSSVRIER